MAKKHKAAEVEVETPVVDEVVTTPEPVKVSSKKSFKNFPSWARSHKKKSVPLGILFVLLVLTLVPQTRYLLPGLVIKKDVQFVLQDKSGLNRITEADVEFDGKLFTSDQNGVVKANGVRPGTKSVKITKLFYKPFNQKISVSLFSNKQFSFNVESTGRPAKVTVKNRLSGRVLAGVSVKTEEGSQAKTGVDGTATLILPSTKSEVKATMSGDNIVTADVTVRAVQDDSTNVYQATPVGRIYFLSKASGKIDIVKTNLDGSDRQVVLAGTGKEDDGGTVLLASKDWKYLALKSRRDSDLAKLYLIDTETDKLTTMDEGNASFTPVGWSDKHFVYLVNRNGLETWQSKAQALKSYNATTKQIIALDETRAEGTSYYDYAYETIQVAYILDTQIVYTKTWYASYYYGTHLADKKVVIAAVKADNTGKKTLKDWPAGYYTYITSLNSGPSEIYYDLTQDGGVKSTWEYDSGTVKETKDLSNEDFSKSYPTYLESPNSRSNFWSEARDGKNTLFVGDVKGENSKEIATLSEYEPYGWYSDDYVLVSKKGSELFIMGRDGIKPGDVPTKISDYHKPEFKYYGYGGY